MVIFRRELEILQLLFNWFNLSLELIPGKTCTYKNVTLTRGQTTMISCMRCTCKSGFVICQRIRGCIDTKNNTEDKPGKCPVVMVMVHSSRSLMRPKCGAKCDNDSSCEGVLKCCPNNCGRRHCVKPKGLFV